MPIDGRKNARLVDLGLRNARFEQTKRLDGLRDALFDFEVRNLFAVRRSDRSDRGLFLLVGNASLHRHHLAIERSEIFVADGHRRCPATEKGLENKLEDLNLALGEAVADTHAN